MIRIDAQYLAFRYAQRLSDAEIEPSVGRVGDSYDNALAESVIGLFKTEVIRQREPWRHLETVEFATLEWVDWFNHSRLLEPIGYVPPAEAEVLYYQQRQESAQAASDSNPRASDKTGAVHSDRASREWIGLIMSYGPFANYALIQANGNDGHPLLEAALPACRSR